MIDCEIPNVGLNSDHTCHDVCRTSAQTLDSVSFVSKWETTCTSKCGQEIITIMTSSVSPVPAFLLLQNNPLIFYKRQIMWQPLQHNVARTICGLHLLTQQQLRPLPRLAERNTTILQTVKLTRRTTLYLCRSLLSLSLERSLERDRDLHCEFFLSVQSSRIIDQQKPMQSFINTIEWYNASLKVHKHKYLKSFQRNFSEKQQADVQISHTVGIWVLIPTYNLTFCDFDYHNPDQTSHDLSPSLCLLFLSPFHFHYEHHAHAPSHVPGCVPFHAHVHAPFQHLSLSPDLLVHAPHLSPFPDLCYHRGPYWVHGACHPVSIIFIPLHRHNKRVSRDQLLLNFLVRYSFTYLRSTDPSLK